jgi:hypothetical protein
MDDEEAEALRRRIPSVTTSPVPGTTLNLIRLPIGSGEFVFDTPGLVNRHQLTPLLTPAELAAVSATKPLSAVTYHLKAGRSLFLGGLCRIDHAGGTARTVLVTVFVAPGVACHLTSTAHADHVYATLVGSKLTPPFDPVRVSPPWARGRVSDVWGCGLGRSARQCWRWSRSTRRRCALSATPRSRRAATSPCAAWAGSARPTAPASAPA